VHRPGHLPYRGALLRQGAVPGGPPVPQHPAGGTTEGPLQKTPTRRDHRPRETGCHAFSSFRMRRQWHWPSVSADEQLNRCQIWATRISTRSDCFFQATLYYHLGQRCLRLGQPERHVHSPVHL
jgi:hypothetical protein